MTLLDKLEQYRTMAETYLTSKGYTLADVKTGADAWNVAHYSGIARDAYDVSREITDAHIKTVLARIMPNAVFKDKYHY